MNPFKVFTKPQYLFNPGQILTRLQRAACKPQSEREVVNLPWGAPIRICPDEAGGATIWYYGIVDLPVAEAIRRLLDPSEVALDIGANVGQMTSLMRNIAGPEGRVFSFEPHPQLFSELSENAKLLMHSKLAPVEIYDFAVSDSEGVAFLEQGSGWTSNRGLAKVVLDQSALASDAFEVKLRLLDEVLPPDIRVGVCKIDVEEHEIHVLRGAEKLLRRGQIRDIIFEDFVIYPSAVQNHLLDLGYTLFSLHTTLFKPELRLLTSQPKFRRSIEGCDFVATLDPDRARKRFESFGWKVFKKHS